MSKTLFEASVETRLLFSHLQKHCADSYDVVSYDELSRVAGIDVCDGGRGYLRTARSMLQREGMVIECVRGEGVRRLRDPETVRTGQRDVDVIRRRATRAMRRVSAVDFEKLSPDDNRVLNVHLAQLGVLKLMSTAKSQTKIEGMVEKVDRKLSTKQVLALFDKNGS